MSKAKSVLVDFLEQHNELNHQYFILSQQADEKRRQARGLVGIDQYKAIRLLDDAEALYAEGLIYLRRAHTLWAANRSLFKEVPPPPKPTLAERIKNLLKS